MVQAGRTGFWQSLKDLPGHMPLRTKLTAAVLALVAIALLVISVAGIGFLRSYLTNQADNSLSGIINSGPTAPQNYVAHHLDGAPQQTASQVAIDWLPTNAKPVQVVQPARNYGQNTEPGPAVAPGASWLSDGQPATVAAASGPGHWRVVAYPWTFHTVSDQPVSGTIVVGIDFSSASRTLTELTGIDVIVSGLLLLVLAVVGVAVIRASLRPLKDIEQTAGAIAAGDLTRRVPERDPRTEVGRLGRSLNVMLSQIETAFHARSQSEASARRSEQKMRQFVADASHELRTPLTAIRGFAEYYRQRGGVDTGGYRFGPAGVGRPRPDHAPRRARGLPDGHPRRGHAAARPPGSAAAARVATSRPALAGRRRGARRTRRRAGPQHRPDRRCRAPRCSSSATRSGSDKSSAI